jgi:hypothetical protein
MELLLWMQRLPRLVLLVRLPALLQLPRPLPVLQLDIGGLGWHQSCCCSWPRHHPASAVHQAAIHSLWHRGTHLAHRRRSLLLALQLLPVLADSAVPLLLQRCLLPNEQADKFLV